MFKESLRTLYWLKLLLTKAYLKTTVKTVTEIGAGESNRIQRVLRLLFFSGTYTSVDHSDRKPPIIPSKFNVNLVNRDYFKVNFPSDILIFDHSIDDILAASFTPNEIAYSKLMENIKKFNYQDPQFIRKMKGILNQAKKLITPHGRIIISNYVTKYDQPRGTVEITRSLLPELSATAQILGLTTDYLSERFLVLKKVKTF